MRRTNELGALLICIGIGVGCTKAPARHCEDFDEAQSLFAAVSGQTLDPSFEDPRYVPVAAAFEAIPKDCARHETAVVTAENIRIGLAKGQARATRIATPPPPVYVPPTPSKRPEVVFPPPAAPPPPAPASAPTPAEISPKEQAAMFAELELIVDALEKEAPDEKAFFAKLRECLETSRGLFMPCMRRCKDSGKAYAECSKTCVDRVDAWMERRGCSDDKLEALIKQRRS